MVSETLNERSGTMNKLYRHRVKVLAVNLFGIFATIGFILLLPPGAHGIYRFVMSFADRQPADNPALLHIYENSPWAEKHFEEFQSMHTDYFDFYVWRRKDFYGETITVVDGIRRTNNTNLDSEHEYWFFGGSSTWGTGVNDENTYPSLFAQQSGYLTRNFGESNYIARQSFNYLAHELLPIIDSSRVKRTEIIFYDGANEVWNKCRQENSGKATNREYYLQKMSNSTNDFSLFKTFQQLQWFLIKTREKLFDTNKVQLDNDFYDCDNNPDKALLVAESLVSAWEQAELLANNYGIGFLAALQPIYYIGSASADYLGLDGPEHSELRKQYEIVYPLIRDLAYKRNISFVDLSDIYDGCGNCYIDYVHVGPQGNALLANRLSELFSQELK